jgi:tetratricopeptide (TPR) repeat protein
MEASLSKAAQLIDLHKYSLALKEADAFLSSEPENARAYALKALAYMGKKQRVEALENAEKAVGLGPELEFSHYILGLVHLNLTKNFRTAELAINEALRINPENPDYYDVLAQLRMVKRDYKEALRLCEKGLEIDPQNVDCRSTRARVLTKMGKKNAAREDLSEALKNDPENPQTLASKGWVDLENGDYQGAQEAFRDALKIKPDYEYARDGLIQALKAKNIIFRWYLRYAFWINRLGNRTRWALVVGIFLLVRFLAFIPGLQGLIGLYILFVISTWIIDPISNLFLRFNKYGKYALSKAEIMGSDLVVGCLVLAVAAGIAAWQLDREYLYTGAAALFLMVIPVSGTASFYGQPAKFRKTLIVSCIIGAFLILGLVLMPFVETAGAGLVITALIGEIFFSWFAGVLAK